MALRGETDATEEMAEAALSSSSDVRNAGENTREVRRTAKCSSMVQSGEPSGNLLMHKVSKRQRSLILLSYQAVADDEVESKS